ncbi:FtsX-like permease family protein [Occallatibacter savannae]|uniref:FtsX-like permease family protein n=1 Tax=Occallatibacter savannae TaxID=1002691 RepID=UPI000D69A58C|nr:FtsX-like permease family protein [Occallatibacter savannae]
MRFELFVAARYLKAKRRQAVVGVVTAISIAGVTAGVAALIIALAITNGMRRDMQDRLIDSSAHIQLMRTNQNEGIHDWRPLLDRLSRLPHVVAAAPELDEQVVVAHGAREGYALVEGIIPQYEKSVSKVLTNAPAAAVKALEPTNESADASPSSQLPPLIIGKELADTIGAAVGDTVTLISPQGELSPLGMIPQTVRFQLVGTYHTGFYQYDSNWGFIRLGDAQRLYDEPDIITVISFRVDNLNHAPEIAKQIETAAGPGFQTTNWKEQNRELFRALRLEQIVTFIVITLIVIVAALNILIALTMMVMEKTRDIAVLMSFGVDPNQVRRIFLLQGFLISLVGTILGLILGYLGAWAGSHYHIGLTPDVYAIDTLPFAPRVIDGIVVATVSISISLLATLYPSSTAARIRPAEALRYE